MTSKGSGRQGNVRQICVLFVEDNPDIRDVVTEFLRDVKFEVIPVESGRRALSLLTVINPDVVLLDMVMPEMDGFEFLTHYRGTAPVVILTAWADDNFSGALPRKPFAVVFKPTPMTEVAKIVLEAARYGREKHAQ